MFYILDSEEMKYCDDNTINYYKVPGLVLMERAALGIVRQVQERFEAESRILIVAGSGNNGGDALAAGRILQQRGCAVQFLVLGGPERRSESMKTQLEILKAYQTPVFTALEEAFDDAGTKKYDMILDGLLGIGVSRPLTGVFEEAVNAMNQSGAFLVAVDIPSGIDADTGALHHTAVRADLTVTFGFRKRGHFFYPGCEYTGELICEDIGITLESFLSRKPGLYTYEACDLNKLPVRKRDGHKGTFGKVVLIAGSLGMSGACELSGKSIFRSGAGMVKIVTEESNRIILQKNLPEAMLLTYQKEESQEGFFRELEAVLSWADCIAIGPGIGTGQMAETLLEWVLTKSSKPAVLDADALNILAERKNYMELLDQQSGQREFILTPHPVEFQRIAGKTLPADRNRLIGISEFARTHGVVLVGKDARTLVAAPLGSCYLNCNGNSGMATAGSGDVLTGIIAGLLCQGMEAYEAAKLGVFIHGMAGDRAVAKSNEYSFMAGDFIEALKEILRIAGK